MTIQELESELESLLESKSLYKRLKERVERFSKKLAPLNKSTGNTQTINRWELDTDNPHYATEEECNLIYELLMQDARAILEAKPPRKLLNPFNLNYTLKKELFIKALSATSRLGSSELPIYYEILQVEGGKHLHTNVFWLIPDENLYNLRDLVAEKKLLVKTQLKSYLTDRRQTGKYQTNREIRWETHPESPQFSSKLDATEVEMKLLAQILTFQNYPNTIDSALLSKILGEYDSSAIFKCPISGFSIDYKDFYKDCISPTHGRSVFQVGHLIPLANGGVHSKENTSWITEIGNRVQGEDSIDIVIKNIFYMANFHKEKDKLTWEQVEELVD